MVLGETIRHKLAKAPEFTSVRQQIEIALVNDGLRVQLLEDSAGTFFELGNSTPSVKGRD